MKNILISLFLSFLFLVSSLNANETSKSQIEQDIKYLSSLSAKSVYNIENEELPIILKPFLEKNKNIKAVIIIESTDNETFMTYFRDENKLIFNKNIPTSLTKLEKKKTPIKYDGEVIGKIVVYYKDKLSLDLSKEEQAWIKNHSIINVGGEMDWAPFDFVNKDGEYSGVSKEYIDLISKMTGLKVKYHIGESWDELLTLFKNGEIDLLPAMYYNKDRENYTNYTNPYLNLSEYFFTKDDYPDINSIEELNGKKIALVKGYTIIKWMKKYHPKIIILEKKNIVECLNSVKAEESIAFIGDNPSTTFQIENNFIVGLKINGVVETRKTISIYMGTKKEYKTLSTIINKALAEISSEQKREITTKWMSVVDKDEIILSDEEKKYLNIHKPIRYVYDPSREPFEYKNDLGVHSGITAEILNLITKKSSLKFEAVPTKDWEESTQLLKDKKVDMVSFIIESKKRKTYLDFTDKTLFKIPIIFVTHADDDNIYENAKFDLKNKKIGIVKGRAIHKKLLEKFPNFNFTEFDSVHEGFEKVTSGEIDMFAINKSSGKYYIKIKGFEKTKIGTSVDVFFNFKMAIQKSLPDEVISIINKSLDAISDEEINEIYNEEVNVKIHNKTNWALISKIGGVILLIVLFVLWNNRKLNIMVDKKTKELRFTVSELEDLKEHLEEQVEDRTKDLNTAKKEVEAIHKHTRESIEYASLIQGAVVSQEFEIKPYFKDSFVHWVPKDTVGGDIWLFNELRHEDECLLFFIDCTGHGVPGAFVTMIVKAVEREITAKINDDINMVISPAWVMAYFNSTMKVLLKQEDKTSISNAGWDGGVIYYNRRDQILKFAGAETPLFYMTKDDEFKTIKGNRYSVGYKKCAMDYEYKETILEVEEGMKFYCTTDGYLDQNGGEKDFPFGKKRFGNIIKENHTVPMEELKTIFIDEMTKYETMIPNNDRNDDMTVIAFEIGKKSDFIENIVEEIVKYEGVMTQNVIASAMDNIEAKITNMGIMGTISTITIEYCQNMMNYSKGIRETDTNDILVPAGIIEVQYHSNKNIDNHYEILATNIVSIEDKEKIEPKLIEIQRLDKQGIKKRYRELRKSGQNTHEKGGGIGMYEIAKISDIIEYEFKAINEDKYYFTMKSIVKPKVKQGKDNE